MPSTRQSSRSSRRPDRRPDRRQDRRPDSRPDNTASHQDHPAEFSYKDVASLRRYVSEQGYIVPRSKTGLSMKQQRRLAKAIKRSRHLGLLPFTQTL